MDLQLCSRITHATVSTWYALGGVAFLRPELLKSKRLHVHGLHFCRLYQSRYSGIHRKGARSGLSCSTKFQVPTDSDFLDYMESRIPEFCIKILDSLNRRNNTTESMTRCESLFCDIHPWSTSMAGTCYLVFWGRRAAFQRPRTVTAEQSVRGCDRESKCFCVSIDKKTRSLCCCSCSTHH